MTSNELRIDLQTEMAVWRRLRNSNASRHPLDQSRQRGKALTLAIAAQKRVYYMPGCSRKITAIKSAGGWQVFNISTTDTVMLKWYRVGELEVAA